MRTFPQQSEQMEPEGSEQRVPKEHDFCLQALSLPIRLLGVYMPDTMITRNSGNSKIPGTTFSK